MLLRPHSMPGGRFHSPLFSPYGIYVDVDYNYGWPAWDAHDGFTGAQASLNLIETVMYLYYLYVVGNKVATGDGFIKGVVTKLSPLKRSGEDGSRIVVTGSGVATAVVVLFAASVMTLSKTILYGFHEVFSGFGGIRQNDWYTLTVYWIFPNGMWIVLPTYMIWLLAIEIVEGLETSSRKASKKSK